MGAVIDWVVVSEPLQPASPIAAPQGKKHVMGSNRFLILFVACIVTFNAGCGGKPQLMPTPNLYAKAGRDPFPDVPAELQTNKVDVLYLTDRKPLKDSTPENRSY